MILLAAVVDDEVEDDDAADFSSPLPQAVRPTINRVDNDNMGIQEFFLNGCVNFIQDALFLIN
jgi:hypothetical protein